MAMILNTRKDKSLNAMTRWMKGGIVHVNMLLVDCLSWRNLKKSMVKVKSRTQFQVTSYKFPDDKIIPKG